MSIKITEHLRVQGARTKGEKYIRVIIPARYAESEDIRPGDLVKITIEEHVKVGRE